MRADAAAALPLRPDPVLAGRHGAQATVALPERRGVPVLRLDPPAGFDAVRARVREVAVRGISCRLGSDDATRAQVREVAAALGVPDRGEAPIHDMDARLAALPHKAAAFGLPWGTAPAPRPRPPESA